LYRERNEEKRRVFLEKIEQIDKNKLYYFDEYGFNLEDDTEYGYAKRGKRLLVPRSGNRGVRLNVLAARNHKHELVAPAIEKKYITKKIFKEYLRTKLLPSLPKWSYLVLDNASFHHDSKADLLDDNIETIKDLAEQFEINIIYLPPFSPDLNPIEKKWAQVRYWYKRLKHNHHNKEKFLQVLLNQKVYSR
jgi:transposase